MVNSTQILILLTTLFAVLSSSTAFWFATEEPKPTSSRVLYSPDYYRQYVPPPLPYSIPFQVPLPAQLSPAAVQNVQLVPCLCPVSQEYSYENSAEYGARKVQPSVQQRRK